MSRRAIVLLAASVIVGLATAATVSTDAFAAKKKPAPQAVVVASPAPLTVGTIDNNYGPVADGIPRCFNSPVLYPYPPCY
jgi:hypothetical protein